MNVLVQYDGVLNIFKSQVVPFVPRSGEVRLTVKEQRHTVGRDNRDDLSTGVMSKSASLAHVDVGTMITEYGIRRLFEVRAYG